MAPTAALSVTSQTCVAMPGALSTVSFSASALRSTAKTRAPSSTKRAVVARPLPQPGPTQPAPVTIAILSLSREPIAAARVPVEGGRGLDHDGREHSMAKTPLGKLRPASIGMLELPRLEPAILAGFRALGDLTGT